jgi:hypothetical protein
VGLAKDLTGVGVAKSVFGDGHAAEAAIGISKVAKVIGRILSSRSHEKLLWMNTELSIISIGNGGGTFSNKANFCGERG